MRLLRLDKFISDAAGLTRQASRSAIRAGRVTVSGEAERRPERKVGDGAEICLDGERLRLLQRRCYMLDKPAGVVTAASDRDHKTVLELFPPQLRRGLAIAGRLDKDTTGLLLLSDDGDWIHRIISPRSHVKKVYLAETDGTPTQADIAAFAQGITLRDGTQCLPARLEILGPGRCRVTVEEGKYHLVRRMLASVGAPVAALRRVQIGALRIDETLAPGGYRALTDAEIEAALINKESII